MMGMQNSFEVLICYLLKYKIGHPNTILYVSNGIELFDPQERVKSKEKEIHAIALN